MRKKEKTKRTENTDQLEDKKTLANRRRLAKVRTAGITLIALVVTIVVLLILAGITINIVFNDNGIFSTAQEAGKKQNRATQNELNQINEIGNFIGNYISGSGNGGGTTNPPVPEIKPSPDSEADPAVSFSTNYGTIDVIWLSGTSNTVASVPNSPVNSLTSGGKSMTPVVFNETTTEWDTVTLDSISADSKNWYEYKAGSSTRNAEGKMVDNNSSKWANARTANNSYFVWIPRYAYRITYYDSETSTTPTGYYDGYGMWKAEDGKVKYKLETKKDSSGNEVKDENGKAISLVETVEHNGNLYIVHPAFTDKIDMGGWSTPTQGFWFAKFEMREENNVLNSIYGKTSLVNQTTGQLYTKGLTATYGYTGLTANSDGNISFMYSHMSKNSEWGACAYLTHSQYGRNGNEITINNQGSVSYRGGGAGKAYANTANQKQSTTGNVYGVYDMSGNAYEFTASWDTLATDPNNYISSNGSSFARKGGPSTKYATAYENGTDTNYGSTGTKNVYNVSKTGDGIKEVWKMGIAGWFGDYSNFVVRKIPFFLRGGCYVEGDSVGVFASEYHNGDANQRQQFPRSAMSVAL